MNYIETLTALLFDKQKEVEKLQNAIDLLNELEVTGIVTSQKVFEEPIVRTTPPRPQRQGAQTKSRTEEKRYVGGKITNVIEEEIM